LQQCRKLKTQGFAAAGRHQRQNVATRQRVAHHGFLPGPKVIEAEDPFQRLSDTFPRRNAGNSCGAAQALVTEVSSRHCMRRLSLRAGATATTISLDNIEILG
jgi:hypothetical protein